MHLYLANSIFVCISLLESLNAIEAKLQCTAPPVNIPTDWITMKDPCIKKVKSQVQEELVAALTYLAMGAHFSKDTINRKGFAQFFFDSASEEREHAIKLMEYLLMRGELTDDISQLIRDPIPKFETWSNALTALKEALHLEIRVTKKLHDIASNCEESDFNDYHLVDWLTAEYLEEQYRSQRDLAGKISELGKMMDNHGALGEFLFDKKLLNGKPYSF